MELLADVHMLPGEDRITGECHPSVSLVTTSGVQMSCFIQRAIAFVVQTLLPAAVKSNINNLNN